MSGDGKSPETTGPQHKDPERGAGDASGEAGAQGGPEGAKPAKPSREDRLAEALRANLRRRKSAAKARKDS